MTEISRPLAGLRVGLSISESEDSTCRGFPGWQVNRTTLYIANTLVGVGAGVVFGHDWRKDGVMTAVNEFASRVQLLGEGHPLLVNLVPWPDQPFLTGEERERLAPTLRVEEAGLPEELRPFEAARDPNGDLHAYLRARGLTHLRHQLDALCDARLCIGGRTRGSKGRYPGIVEEALIAVQRRTPLYLAGILGGATRLIIDAVEGKEMPDGFGGDSNLARLYQRPPNGIDERWNETRPDREVNPAAAWAAFRQGGVRALARGNGLTEDENRELFHTSVLDRVTRLMLLGLSRIHRGM